MTTMWRGPGPSTADSTTASWVRRFHPAPSSQVRLACFPHAGGSASFYVPVSRAMAPAVEVLAVQYPGRQDRRRDPVIDGIPALADAACRALLDYTDRRLALFGHSMGAIVAYEVALRLEAAGFEVAHLFASGRRAPSRYRDESVHERDDKGVLAELRLLSGTDPAIIDDPELVDLVLPPLRHDYRAIETYRHDAGRRLRCRVTALVGADDPRTSMSEAEAWAAHTTGPFDLAVFPGGHFFLAAPGSGVTDLVRRRLTTGAIAPTG